MFESVPSPNAPRACEILGRRENAVAEIGFRDRAKTRDGAAGGQPLRLVVRQMRRVHEAPALVDVRMIEQPFDGTRTGRGDAIFDFLRLLGGMNVDGTGRRERHDTREFFRRRRAQAVRRHADIGVFQICDRALRRLEKLCEASPCC